MNREEYDVLVHRFGNVVQRQLVVSCGGNCPVCDQYVVNPNWRSPIRWLAQGLVNTGRALMFMIVVAFVLGFAAYVFLAINQLLGLWEPN